MSEKKYELSEVIVPCVPCWEVFADYDGNAPDTAGLVACADPELAKEVCELLASAGPDNGPVEWVGKKWLLPLPCVEGYQFSRRFEISLAYRPREAAIATSVSEAIQLLDGDCED